MDDNQEETMDQRQKTKNGKEWKIGKGKWRGMENRWEQE